MNSLLAKVTGSFLLALLMTAAVPKAYFAHAAPVQKARPAPSPVPNPALDDAVAEAGRLRQELAKAYESINVMNPMSPQYGKGTPPAPGSPPPAAPIAQLQQILGNPAVQGYLKFFSSPAFAQGT